MIIKLFFLLKKLKSHKKKKINPNSLRCNYPAQTSSKMFSLVNREKK
jgi:hypothetical protein